MDNAKTQPKRENAVQAAYREMEELKPRLPKDWRTRFFLKYKEYDSAGGGRLVNDIYYQRSTDSVILAGLKAIAAEYEAEQKQAS